MRKSKRFGSRLRRDMFGQSQRFSRLSRRVRRRQYEEDYPIELERAAVERALELLTEEVPAAVESAANYAILSEKYPLSEIERDKMEDRVISLLIQRLGVWR